MTERHDSKQTTAANDLPLASKETMTLDSHRPLSYENTQNVALRQTDYNIRTPNIEDFMTKDSNNGGGAMLLPEEEREDRIRTIQATSDEDEPKRAFTKKSSAKES